MFEIYRDQYTNDYCVVYFTELNDHNRDKEIDKALAGAHFYDGFIKEFKKDDAKLIINDFLRRMNEGEVIEVEDFVQLLGDHIPVMT